MADSLRAHRTAAEGWVGEGSIEDHVRQFYQLHAPAKLEQLDKILFRYKGRERRLLADLRRKYGCVSR